MRGWPEEVIAWLRENVPGRTTKQVTELINQQGFDKKYEMVFSDAAIKGAKNRYGIKSGTTGGVPKGYSLKYPEGMESYIRSIATGRKTKEIAELVSAHFGIEFSEKQCKAYKKNHDIISGVDCRFEKGHVPANKGKPMSQEQYEKCKATMFKKGDVPANHMEVGEYTHTAILSGRLKKPVHNGRGLSLFIGQYGKNTTDQFPKARWYRSWTATRTTVT